MTNPVLIAHGLYDSAVVTRGTLSASASLLNRSFYPCDTTAGSFVVYLPASPPVGAEVTVGDYARSFAGNPLLVDGNGSTILGLLEQYSVNTAGATRCFFFVENVKGWMVK